MILVGDGSHRSVDEDREAGVYLNQNRDDYFPWWAVDLQLVMSRWARVRKERTR